MASNVPCNLNFGYPAEKASNVPFKLNLGYPVMKRGVLEFTRHPYTGDRKKAENYARFTWPAFIKKCKPPERDAWEGAKVRRGRGDRIEQKRKKKYEREYESVPEYIGDLYPPRRTKPSHLGDWTLEKYVEQSNPKQWKNGCYPKLPSESPLIPLLALRSDARRPDEAVKKRHVTDRHLPRVQKPLPPPPFSVFRPPTPTYCVYASPTSRRTSRHIPTVYIQYVSLPRMDDRTTSSPF